MKTRFYALAYALYILVCVLPGCDNAAQKKARAEQEATKNGMDGNPGAYSPAPLNTSMTPHASPAPSAEPK